MVNEVLAEFKKKKQTPVEKEICNRWKKDKAKKSFVVEHRPKDDQSEGTMFAFERWKNDKWCVWGRYKKQKDALQAIENMGKGKWYWSRFKFRLKESKDGKIDRTKNNKRSVECDEKRAHSL